MMRGAAVASRPSDGGVVTTRAPAPLRFRSAHLPLSFCACCSIASVASRTDTGHALASPLPRRTWSPRVCTAASVRSRYFSLVRMTTAEMAASFSRRSTRASRLVISCRRAGVTVTCRPVISSRIVIRLEQHLALVRSGDLQLLAVFRDGPAREHQPFLLEDAHDLGVAERLPRILVLDDLADALLDGDRRHALAVRTADPAVEEV